MKKSFKYQLNAVAMALALSANAWALTPQDGTPDLSLFIPGSQANDPAFGFLVKNTVVANAVCLDKALPGALSGTSANTDTTTHIYFNYLSGSPTAAINDNYSAIYCYTDDTKIPGLTTGDASNHHKTKLWISRRRLGASYIGLNAVAHPTDASAVLTYLADPTTAGCTAINGSYSTGGSTYQWNYSCSTVSATGTANGITGNIPASAATSDITPDVFYAADNVALPPAGSTLNYAPIQPGQIPTANIHALGGHIIGVPVTLVLRNALQYAEISTGQLPSTCTVGNDTNPDCMPTLTKQQLTSLFTGAVSDWSQFQITATKTLYDLIAAAPTGSGVSAPLDTQVHLCRRENGAGQQVAVLANLLQYPCLGSTAPELATPQSAPYTDVEYATSLGAVDKCLADFNDGTNGWFGTTNPSPYPQPPCSSAVSSCTTKHGNQWALSIQTTERNATNGANYRFIAIDGAAPTGEAAYLGHYPIIGTYALSWNQANVTANQHLALNAIAAYSKLPATIASRNNSLSPQLFGQAGYLSLVDNGFQPPLVWNTSNPTTPYSRLDSGNHPNACVIPTVNSSYGQAQLF
ncbi:hypothetical protein [Methylomonas sp. AM2-LC]|uniref:hypothetical protein n=1 Tax=Methylomonas sp. AM2-LC TaxID=3153301 RepID=UPI0032632266